MLYLLGSIVFTSYLALSFKALEKWNINSFRAIVFNYITCVITGSLFNGRFPLQRNSLQEHWFPVAVLMGSLFIAIFNILALATRRNGVSEATVAFKLSLVIPFIFSAWFYGELIGIIEIAGILLALVSVVLTCYPRSSVNEKSTGTRFIYLIPFILFISSGLLDSLVKYAEQAYMNESNNNDFLITAFFVAGLLGLGVLAYQALFQKKIASYKEVLAGIAIGIPNYFSIWCLVKVLKLFPGKSSAIIPVNNMGIVLFSAVMSVVLFKEKLSAINRAGILLALLAIAAIAFG